jgi:hypothetical protein
MDWSRVKGPGKTERLPSVSGFFDPEDFAGIEVVAQLFLQMTDDAADRSVVGIRRLSPQDARQRTGADSLDYIEPLLQPLYRGYLLRAPKFQPGVKLFRARVFVGRPVGSPP